MALHDDLLIHAHMLAMVDIGQHAIQAPLQVNLRRAISSAYYAVFHLLIAESVDLLVPAEPPGLAGRVSRSFTHNEMNRVCGIFARQQLTDELRELLPNGISAGLNTVARIFCQLQQERHSADYDINFTTLRSLTLTRINEAEEAFTAWKSIRETEEATVFLASLAFASRWSK